LTFDSVRGTGPVYLKQAIWPVSESSRRSLRSADRGDLFILRANTSIGQRSFSIAAPVVWNTLPPDLRSPLNSRRQFRSKLKTHHADPDPAALAAGQLQNQVQAVLPRPRHPLRSQPGVSDGNSPVSRRQQTTFRATLIFHLVDGLLSSTAAHEVRRAGVLTCGSCHLERSARQHPHRG